GTSLPTRHAHARPTSAPADRPGHTAWSCCPPVELVAGDACAAPQPGLAVVMCALRGGVEGAVRPPAGGRLSVEFALPVHEGVEVRLRFRDHGALFRLCIGRRWRGECRG